MLIRVVHSEWHVDSGLVATMIEAPLELQQRLTIPQNHWDVCAAAGTPTKGNAAGNTENLLDLTGANKSPEPLPAGFTARGIVALVFSCISAFLGMAVISWCKCDPIVFRCRCAHANTHPCRRRRTNRPGRSGQREETNQRGRHCLQVTAKWRGQRGGRTSVLKI